MSGQQSITESHRMRDKTVFERWSPVITTLMSLMVMGVIIPWAVWTTTTIFSMKERIAVAASHERAASDRIASIESKGSANFQSQQALDNERFVDVKARVAALEAAVIMLSDVKAQLATINVRFEGMNARLVEQQGQLNQISKRLFDNK